MYLPCIVVEIEDWSLQKLRRHAVTSLHVSHDMKQHFFWDNSQECHLHVECKFGKVLSNHISVISTYVL